MAKQLFKATYILFLLKEATGVAPVPGYQLYNLLNCYNNEIGQDWADNTGVCARRCDAANQCVAFVYLVYTPYEGYCYLKSVCNVNSLVNNGQDIHTYIKVEQQETTTEEIVLTTQLTTSDTISSSTIAETTTIPNETNPMTSTELYNVTTISNTTIINNTTKGNKILKRKIITIYWSEPFKLDTTVYDPKEAPLAVGIGSCMIGLLIAFALFFFLLDLNNYRKGLRKGYHNFNNGLTHFFKIKPPPVDNLSDEVPAFKARVNYDQMAQPNGTVSALQKHTNKKLVKQFSRKSLPYFCENI